MPLREINLTTLPRNGVHFSLVCPQATPRFYLVAVEKGEGLGSKPYKYVMTGNGGLGVIMMATCPRTMWPVRCVGVALSASQ